MWYCKIYAILLSWKDYRGHCPPRERKLNMAKRKFGDRKDGRRIRDLDGLHKIMLHIMPKRTESEVYLEFPMDVTDLLPYIEEKNHLHPEYKTTIFHCLVTAVARVVTMRPAITSAPWFGKNADVNSA